MSAPDVQIAMERALAATSTAEAWAALEPLRPRLLEDRDVAVAWLALLQASPSALHLVVDARAIAGRWPDDPGLVAAAATALVRRADKDGPDAPVEAGGAAEIALTFVDAALAHLGPDARADADVGGPLVLARGNALRRLGRDADALLALEAAVKLGGAHVGDALFDLGRLHLWARRFRAALVAFEKSLDKALLGGSAGARRAHFAIGVAATGAGDGERALSAWRALGMNATAEVGRPPVAPGLGPVLVRIAVRAPSAASAGLPDASAGFEEVRVERLSPCHGVVVTATRGDGACDAGDVVLFDVAPVRRAEVDGSAVPVLPLLGVLLPGDERRLRVLALEQEEGQAAHLLSEIEGCTFIEHERRIETVCPRCAAGDVLTRHEHLPAEAHRAVLGKLVVPSAVPLERVAAALEGGARDAGTTRPVLLAIPALYEALGKTAEAGKHHKTWGAIERGVSGQTARTRRLPK